ncbi:MAG: LysR family transcriptional regulator [Betaproteobacteria bacterium]|nr:LysR family transcriptional regulator [Betaproteobacteria bacterium]
MDFKQLQYFVAVAEAGSFTKAALRLAVDQPALSKQVRRLEIELRQALFRRNGRGIALTEGGKVLLAHARGILNQVEQTREALDATRDGALGNIAIAAPALVKRLLTATFVTAFRSRFPQASLEIVEGRSSAIQEWLLEGRIDIGVVHGPASRPGIELIRLTDHDLYLVSPRKRAPFPASAAVSVRTLEKLPLILPSPPHSVRMLLEEEAARLGGGLHVVLQVEGAEFIVELVQQGHGFGILSSFSLSMRNLSDELQLTPIVQPRLTRSLNIAFASQRRLSKLARESLALIQDCLLSPPVAGDTGSGQLPGAQSGSAALRLRGRLRRGATAW